MRISAVLYFGCFAALSQLPASADEPSVERGLYVSIVGGCHDCHTEGYSESGGAIDPEKALKGSTVGRQGPWGTSYPGNLRRDVANLSEDGFIRMVKSVELKPPMPWYNVRRMTEDDLRSLYRYVQSLGEPGDNVPQFVAPGDRVNTPFIVLVPPQMPPPAPAIWIARSANSAARRNRGAA